jgi:DNA-binding NtrC family response regulator
LPGKINVRDSLKGTLETILVVDDDAVVRKVVVNILERANFRVLSAESGPAALKLVEPTSRKIDLLLSDVDMPQMSGPDLGEILKKARPDMHVMLMSGGNNGNLLVLNYGWAFVQKPFVATKLVEMVTDVLHSENRSQLGGQEFDTRKDTKNPNCDKSKVADAHPADGNEPKDWGTQ